MASSVALRRRRTGIGSGELAIAPKIEGRSLAPAEARARSSAAGTDSPSLRSVLTRRRISTSSSV